MPPGTLAARKRYTGGMNPSPTGLPCQREVPSASEAEGFLPVCGWDGQSRRARRNPSGPAGHLPLTREADAYNPFTSAITCSTASSFVAQLVHTRTAVWCLSGLPMWVMA